jgi:hypothetical protein
MPPPAGTAERDLSACLLPADTQRSCSGLSWEQLIHLFQAVLPSYTEHAHGSSLAQAIRDLTLAWAGDWLAQDEYNAEVSKLISCAAAVTIHASPSAVDASPKPNLLRKEPASLCAADTTPARDHGSPTSLPNPQLLIVLPLAVYFHDRVASRDWFIL